MTAISLNTTFNLADLFNQVHGYRPAYVAGLPVNEPGQPTAIVPPSLKKTHNPFGEPYYGQADLMGHEVFCPITIEVAGKDYQFPFAVIGFSRTKTIIETEMTELNGSVDEIISNRDWDISIKGFLIGQYEQFPDEQLQMLNKVFEVNETVRLKSAISDIFLHDNDSILIRKMEIPEKPKVIGVRDFSFQAKSCSIFSLYQN